MAGGNPRKEMKRSLDRAECLLHGGQGQREENPTLRLSQNNNHGTILLDAQSREDLFWII